MEQIPSEIPTAELAEIDMQLADEDISSSEDDGDVGDEKFLRPVLEAGVHDYDDAVCVTVEELKRYVNEAAIPVLQGITFSNFSKFLETLE